MEFMKQIAGNFVFRMMQFSENKPNNSANPRIIEQFFVSHHQDSLQITLIEKIDLHPRE